jgi:hypothetical protein
MGRSSALSHSFRLLLRLLLLAHWSHRHNGDLSRCLVDNSLLSLLFFLLLQRLDTAAEGQAENEAETTD